jgi:hypothetical protein
MAEIHSAFVPAAGLLSTVAPVLRTLYPPHVLRKLRKSTPCTEFDQFPLQKSDNPLLLP